MARFRTLPNSDRWIKPRTHADCRTAVIFISLHAEIKICCFPVDSNPCRLSSESGALSLSSAARHIDFHLFAPYIQVCRLRKRIPSRFHYNITNLSYISGLKCWRIWTSDNAPCTIQHGRWQEKRRSRELTLVIIAYMNAVREFG